MRQAGERERGLREWDETSDVVTRERCSIDVCLRVKKHMSQSKSVLYTQLTGVDEVVL